MERYPLMLLSVSITSINGVDMRNGVWLYGIASLSLNLEGQGVRDDDLTDTHR
jgi:hypothetical protein